MPVARSLPQPRQALMQAQPRQVGRRSPRTWHSTVSCSFPATPPSFLFGVNSFWVVSHPKIECRWGQCVFPQSKSLRTFPDGVGGISTSQSGHDWVNMEGARSPFSHWGPPRWPGIPVSAGAKETAPNHEGNLCLDEESVHLPSGLEEGRS